MAVSDWRSRRIKPSRLAAGSLLACGQSRPELKIRKGGKPTGNGANGFHNCICHMRMPCGRQKLQRLDAESRHDTRDNDGKPVTRIGQHEGSRTEGKGGGAVDADGRQRMRPKPDRANCNDHDQQQNRPGDVFRKSICHHGVTIERCAHKRKIVFFFHRPINHTFWTDTAQTGFR